VYDQRCRLWAVVSATYAWLQSSYTSSFQYRVSSAAVVFVVPTFQVPFDVDQSWDKKYTYLDTQGRPVLVLKRGLTLPVHNQPFAVDFQFGTLALLREPMLLISGTTT
jgi:hypothetical protein